MTTAPLSGADRWLWEDVARSLLLWSWWWPFTAQAA